MKSKIFLLITGCFAVLLTSCLGDSDYDSYYEVDKNCQITEFSLSSDSVSGLSDVKFTIDQLNGRIMNLDSMPFGTEIEKVICTVKYGSYVTKLEVIQEATGDTIDWNAEDSLDFSKPVKFITSSYDGMTKRVYVAQVNVHQVVPDSMVWRQYTTNILPTKFVDQKVISFNDGSADYYYMYVQPEANTAYKFYRSKQTDAKSWEELPLTGLPASGVLLSQITSYNNLYYVATKEGSLYSSADAVNWQLVEGTPKVKSLLGYIDESTNQPAVLSAVVEEESGLVFAAMNAEGQWETGEMVPAHFPVEGFSSASIYLMYTSRVMVVGGKSSDGQLQNASWATMNALDWAEQTDSYGDYFTKRQGTMMAYYDNMFYLIGGIDESGKPQKDIYRSSDYGVTWNYIDTLVVLPSSYQARGFASMLVDKDNYLMIFGGKSTINGQDLNDIWKGRINRLGFERQ